MESLWTLDIFTIWLTTLLTMMFMFALFGALGEEFYWVLENEGKACMPDGTFSVDSSNFRWFSISGFFQITLEFGNLNFTQVKAIDIIGDIVSHRMHSHPTINYP
jgi:hypothetical protein